MKITTTHNMLCKYRDLQTAVCKRSTIPEKCKRCKVACTVYQMYMNSHEVCQALNMESGVEK
jgi:hypothetical protein